MTKATLILGIAVFLSDAAIDYLAGRWQDARRKRQRRRAIILAGLMNLVISISAMGLVEQKWLMIPPSILGAMVGTLLSMPQGRRRKKWYYQLF